MSDRIELMITLLTMGIVLYTVWRHGRSNPESTGDLARRVGQLGKKLDAHVELSKARDARVEQLAEQISEMSDGMVRASDLAALRAEISADRVVNQRTWEAVSRIEHFFLRRGIEGSDR